MAEILTRTTQVQDQVVEVFSIDGRRWDSDLERLRAWHSVFEPRQTAGDWVKEAASRGRRRSVRSRSKGRKKLKECEKIVADGLPEDWPEEIEYQITAR